MTPVIFLLFSVGENKITKDNPYAKCVCLIQSAGVSRLHTTTTLVLITDSLVGFFFFESIFKSW